jgi:hypothetical protein
VAYLVIAPTVNVSRGVPVTVTDSENAIVNVGVSAGLYVALLGAVTVLIVGDVRSITIVDEAKDALMGPTDEPVTEFALSLGCRVPSPHEETDNVYEVPLPPTEKEQFIAVPAFSKSAFSMPVTDSVITNE